ncbi:MAG: cytochrome c biogenesis protein CcdA [Candidatus Levybacteria bacterium]|nr:cytochrome c biogenesis protein CcdA [Candidatus Levybacteria bacterium]
MEGLFFQTSLIAAFAAGIVALFAPCCITFLLPAYLGGVFKEKEKVLLMTLVFGLGIFVVLLPAVLGVSFVSRLLFRYHDQMFVIGGIVMILVSAVSLLGIKLPMPRIPGRNTGKTDVISIFMLGVFSGITSACCAPVLIGILTFAFLSPNFWGALLVGAMYVLGMVTPLLFISAFLSGKTTSANVLKKPIATINLGRKYTIILSNFIAFLIFFITGSLTLFLAFTGRLTMERATGFTKIIQNAGGLVNQYVGGNVILNLVFFGVLIYALYKISRKI